ncbi:MAG: universal stress protein UspA [Saprospiraceae bacterium]|nr:MAG: universal stress protein UspA [Saprospiraceae bacterium]
MNSILVPTDFSTCAGYAVHAAMQLAKKTKSAVHLYHTLSPTKDDSDQQQAYEHAETNLHAVKTQHPDIDIFIKIEKGPLVDNLGKYTAHHTIDMIIMGSQGASNRSLFYLGSNTQKVIREVHCPVLVIKKPLSKVDFSKVAFASSFNWDDRPAFEKFKDFVKHFIPEIHLLAIQTTSLFDAPAIVTLEAMEEFKKLAQPLACHIHLKREGNVDTGILDFVHANDIQLIGISNVHRHPVKRIFSGSNVEALVNHAEVPVLSIDYLRS